MPKMRLLVPILTTGEHHDAEVETVLVVGDRLRGVVGCNGTTNTCHTSMKISTTTGSTQEISYSNVANVLTLVQGGATNWQLAGDRVCCTDR
jgi:hypothetical protein